MEVKVGEIVQAVDELGRWENGKVTASDLDTVTVHFPGWGEEFDVTVNPHEVRKPVDGLTVSGPQRKRRLVPRAKQELLKRLCKGDEVNLSGSEGISIVHEVDQFQQTISVMVGDGIRVADIMDIHIDQPNSPPPRKQRKKQNPQLPLATKEAPASDLNNVKVACTEQDQNNFFEDNVDGFATLYNAVGEQIQCGSQVVAGAIPSVPMMLTRLAHKGGLFIGDAVLLHDDQICITSPIDKLTSCKTPLSKEWKKRGKALFDQAFQQSLDLAKRSFIFRKVQRENRLSHLIRDSVQQLLKGSSNRKAVVLGIFEPSVDVPLFGIHPLSKRSATFAYRSSNLSALDTLLGPRWDIFAKESHVRFVTRVILKLGRGDMLTCLMFAASSAEVLTDSYRDVLEHEVRTF